MKPYNMTIGNLNSAFLWGCLLCYARTEHKISTVTTQIKPPEDYLTVKHRFPVDIFQISNLIYF